MTAPQGLWTTAPWSPVGLRPPSEQGAHPAAASYTTSRDVNQIDEGAAVDRLAARGRNDDTPDAILNRLAWYKRDVLPQLEMLRGRGRTIHVIDGGAPVDEIHQNILKALGLEH